MLIFQLFTHSEEALRSFFQNAVSKTDGLRVSAKDTSGIYPKTFAFQSPCLTPMTSPSDQNCMFPPAPTHTAGINSYKGTR